LRAEVPYFGDDLLNPIELFFISM